MIGLLHGKSLLLRQHLRQSQTGTDKNKNKGQLLHFPRMYVYYGSGTTSYAPFTVYHPSQKMQWAASNLPSWEWKITIWGRVSVILCENWDILMNQSIFVFVFGWRSPDSIWTGTLLIPLQTSRRAKGGFPDLWKRPPVCQALRGSLWWPFQCCPKPPNDFPSNVTAPI